MQLSPSPSQGDAGCRRRAKGIGQRPSRPIAEVASFSGDCDALGVGKIFRTRGDEVDIVTQRTALGIADILALPIGWDWGKSKRQSALLHQAVCEGNASAAACGLPVLSPLRSASAPMTSSTATFFLFAR